MASAPLRGYDLRIAVASFVASTAVLSWDSVRTVCFAMFAGGLGARR
jgi:hypothetical protein